MNISGCKQQQSAISIQHSEGSRAFSQILFWLLYSGFCILSVVSCAPKQVVAPSYEGDLNDLLSKLQDTKTVEAVLAIDYEKNDSTMSGDASLNISDNSLLLRIYYLGFLAGEVKEDNGVIQSKPRLDKNKSIILVDGLKYSFFWWNIKNHLLDERDGLFVLRNSYRKVYIDKKTLLPVKQTIELHNGEELNIFYDTPAKTAAADQLPETGEKAEDPPPVANRQSLPLWYQSNLRIEFRNHAVKIKVKSYEAKGQ